MKLSEIASFPYFHEPFICVTKDKNDLQYAVIFHSADKFETLKLPITYENIINQLEAQGFKIKVGKNFTAEFTFV
jgi:tRNA splicing endonuclease